MHFFMINGFEKLMCCFFRRIFCTVKTSTDNNIPGGECECITGGILISKC